MIRKATPADVKTIHKLITEQATPGHLLPRALSELYGQVRDFLVHEDDQTGELDGCGALAVIWEDLAEVRSLAVATEHQGRGIGSELTRALVRDASVLGLKRAFVLTYRPSLFQRLGFELLDKKLLPHKIWADCIRCTKFPDCDEIALARDL